MRDDKRQQKKSHERREEKKKNMKNDLRTNTQAVGRIATTAEKKNRKKRE